MQGYAGVGKTTQFNAVKAAIDTLPADARPVIVGLGPTHRAVKEMAGTVIDAQTLKCSGQLILATALDCK